MRALPIWVLLGMLVPAAPTLAWDDDIKAYSAAFCETSRGTIKFFGPQIENPSKDKIAEVTCPIVNDEEDGINWAQVFVIKRHWDEVTCRLQSMSTRVEQVYAFYEQKSTTDYPRKPQTISFGSLPHFEGWGVYSVTCHLPKWSFGYVARITGYRVEED